MKATTFLIEADAIPCEMDFSEDETHDKLMDAIWSLSFREELSPEAWEFITHLSQQTQ